MNKISCNLYVVTDEKLSHGKSHSEIAYEAVRGGADVIQLRDKFMSSAELFSEAVKIKKICSGKALFIVNDRIDIALASNADGVHLGQNDLPIKEARKIAPQLIIGASAGCVQEALNAVNDGADYIAVSPVFDTASKDDAGCGVGIEMIKEISSAVPNFPVIGIGGLNKSNIASVIDAGLDGIAVISAVVSSPDICKSAKELSELIRNCKRKCKNE